MKQPRILSSLKIGFLRLSLNKPQFFLSTSRERAILLFPSEVSDVNMNHSARSTPRKGSTRAPPLRIKRRAQSPDTKQSLLPDKRLLLVLISLRMLNALTIKTFFQPDEYYQSLEPAWKSVFGYGELTWEWKEGIRGFLYPSIFASLWWILKTLGVTNPYILVHFLRRK